MHQGRRHDELFGRIRRECRAGASLGRFPLKARALEVSDDLRLALQGALPGVGLNPLESRLLPARGHLNRFPGGGGLTDPGELPLQHPRRYFHA